jgi:hypothetical protein
MRYTGWTDRVGSRTGRGVFIPGEVLAKMGFSKSHNLVYRSGGRTLILWRHYEEWRCDGCGIVFLIKGRSIQRVGKMTTKLMHRHAHYMSWTSVFTQLAEFKWNSKAEGLVFKADLSRSIYGERDEAHGTVR